DVAAHLGFAHWLLCQGRTEEALAWSRRAQQLDPLGVTGVSNGWILFHARRYDEAMRELRSVLAVHPDYATARWFLGFVLIGSGSNAIPRLASPAPDVVKLIATSIDAVCGPATSCSASPSDPR